MRRADLPDKLLTTVTMAELLDCSELAVRRKAERGQIPGAFKVGRHWRFDPRDVAAWLDSLREEAA